MSSGLLSITASRTSSGGGVGLKRGGGGGGSRNNSGGAEGSSGGIVRSTRSVLLLSVAVVHVVVTATLLVRAHPKWSTTEHEFASRVLAAAKSAHISRGSDSANVYTYPVKSTNITGSVASPTPSPVPASSSLASNSSLSISLSRRARVVDAFRSSWAAYERFAWGCDELHPLSHSCMQGTGLGLQIIDALDTTYMMGLDEEFRRGRDFVQSAYVSADSLGNGSGKVSFFETTIRALGGLLSAFELSNDAVFVAAASRLADALMPAFASSASAFPYAFVDLSSGEVDLPNWLHGRVPLADATTCILEWSRLSNITGEARFHDAAKRAFDAALALPHIDGFVTGFLIDPESGTVGESSLTLGPLADSHYEYLIKEWLLSGKAETSEESRRSFEDTVRGVLQKFVATRKTKGGFLLADISLDSQHTVLSQQDHLACFFPGAVALAVMSGGLPDDLVDAASRLAVETATGCYKAFYAEQPSGLAPEVLTWPSGNADETIVQGGGYTYRLRPETVESLFYVYRLSGKNETYADWAFNIFEAIEKHARVSDGSGAFATVNMVNTANPTQADSMDTFWLAETLKYFFLIFSDDEISITKWVFNTEAHPLRIGGAYRPKR